MMCSGRCWKAVWKRRSMTYAWPMWTLPIDGAAEFPRKFRERFFGAGGTVRKNEEQWCGGHSFDEEQFRQSR